MTKRQLDSKVDLYKVLKGLYGWESPAVWRLIHDGRVLIDGHVVLPQWAQGHWSVRHIAGRMLQIPSFGLSRRLYEYGP